MYRYSSKLAEQANGLLPYAAVGHLFFAAWAFSAYPAGPDSLLEDGLEISGYIKTITDTWKEVG